MPRVVLSIIWGMQPDVGHNCLMLLRTLKLHQKIQYDHLLSGISGYDFREDCIQQVIASKCGRGQLGRLCRWPHPHKFWDIR